MKTNILHPGNGINFPSKGDYVKFNMMMCDEKETVLFDSKNCEKGFCEIRFKCESGYFEQIEELIGEMSLYEKCSLELDRSDLTKVKSKEIRKLIQQYNRIIIYIEVIHISPSSHFA